MGQAVSGLMFGEFGGGGCPDERGLTFASRADRPTYSEDGLLGFWVFLGTSGKGWSGIPVLETEVRFDRLLTTEPFAAAYEKARARYEAFRAKAAEKNWEVPEGALYFTTGEVA